MPDTNYTPLSSTSRTIFLAEDDIDDQEFLRDALQTIDPTIHLISFSNGLKFIHHLKETADSQLPCLIILDYNIPELNGAEILGQLKDQTRLAAIPKVVWSTSDSPLYRENCLAFGAKAYLVKPSSISGITEVAKEMLGYCGYTISTQNS